jgi:hypothetical protein
MGHLAVGVTRDLVLYDAALKVVPDASLAVNDLEIFLFWRAPLLYVVRVVSFSCLANQTNLAFRAKREVYLISISKVV